MEKQLKLIKDSVFVRKAGRLSQDQVDLVSEQIKTTATLHRDVNKLCLQLYGVASNQLEADKLDNVLGKNNER